MTAEIATMKVNEQVDALESMGVDPQHYLVVPRVWASLCMIPLLCAVFMFMGMVGAFVVGITLYNVDRGVFLEKLVLIVATGDVFFGIRKALMFSFVISLVSCRYGLRASGGAKGVGVATTNSVVVSLILLLIVDFFMSFLEVKWGS